MENEELNNDILSADHQEQGAQGGASKSQLAKIKERFAKLTDQLRRTTMILKKREKSYYELEEKFASAEREVEIEREKNQRLEQQFKESMEGTLDVEALKNVTVLNAQLATLKKELGDSQAMMAKLKADTAAKIKALQEGLQDEMSKAAHAKADVEAQLFQLQEERARYANYQEDHERMNKELLSKNEILAQNEAELLRRQDLINQKENEIQLEQQKFAQHLKEDETLAQQVTQERENLNSELQRLDEICRVFDVIQLEADILSIRDKVHKVTRHPDQRELKLMLQQVELLKNRIDAFEKMTADRVANYFNAALEMEAILKNQILLEA